MRIHVYMHVAGMNHYREVVKEIGHAISESGLYSHAESLNAVTVGPALTLGLLPTRWRTVLGSKQLGAFEYPTLSMMQAHARLVLDDIFFYCHTKGVAHPEKKEQRDQWRRYLIRHTVERWRECVEKLETVQVVGTDYRQRSAGGMHHIREPRFTGNWWWARGSHLAALPLPGPHLTRRSPRMGAEVWVLAINPTWSEIHAKPGFNWENGFVDAPNRIPHAV